jgi:hypothetical protein
MNDIAVNALSRRSKRVWTTPGLGDRALVVAMLGNYVKKHGPTRLHLNREHTRNGRIEKWLEMAQFVPEVEVIMHDVGAMDDGPWKQYLSGKGYGAQLYYFTESVGITPMGDFNLHTYLKKSPLLPASPVDYDLPEKYMVEQWDSTDPKRRATPAQKKQIRKKWLDQGYELITIGGEATSDFAKYDLTNISHLVANSSGFVGVNSGMFCFSWLFLPFDKIWFYGKPGQDHVDWMAKWCNFNEGVSEFKAEK